MHLARRDTPGIIPLHHPRRLRQHLVGLFQPISVPDQHMIACLRQCPIIRLVCQALEHQKLLNQQHLTIFPT